MQKAPALSEGRRLLLCAAGLYQPSSISLRIFAMASSPPEER